MFGGGAFKKGRLASLSIFLTLRKQNASWGLFEGGGKNKTNLNKIAMI